MPWDEMEAKRFTNRSSELNASERLIFRVADEEDSLFEPRTEVSIPADLISEDLFKRMREKLESGPERILFPYDPGEAFIGNFLCYYKMLLENPEDPEISEILRLSRNVEDERVMVCRSILLALIQDPRNLPSFEALKENPVKNFPKEVAFNELPPFSEYLLSPLISQS